MYPEIYLELYHQAGSCTTLSVFSHWGHGLGYRLGWLFYSDLWLEEWRPLRETCLVWNFYSSCPNFLLPFWYYSGVFLSPLLFPCAGYPIWDTRMRSLLPIVHIEWFLYFGPIKLELKHCYRSTDKVNHLTS